VLSRDECGFFAASLEGGPLLVDVCTTAGTPAAMRARHARKLAWLDANGRPTAATLVVLNDKSIKPLDAEMKAAVTDTTKELTPLTLCSAVVINADRFKAAAFRSIVAMLTLVVKTEAPLKTSSTVAEALAWIAEVLPTSARRTLPSLAQLEAAWAAIERDAAT
jgi:hypothetical protein